jgi:hypothetical protein
MDTVYLEFNKTFDKVPRTQLLRKWRQISTEVVYRIETWLTGRTHRMKVNIEKSGEEGEVGSEIPQGTVLRPCLFTIFIDDTDDCSVGQITITKLADDTKSLRTVVLRSQNFWPEIEPVIATFCSGSGLNLRSIFYQCLS